ncbi:hypothetical protein K438DRAFT_1788228 [Mycena galopus ATCC 62051]|nr:hypothetical protein K438DRAFT_1788228 [Mycena galopus ATCC 62051]
MSQRLGFRMGSGRLNSASPSAKRRRGQPRCCLKHALRRIAADTANSKLRAARAGKWGQVQAQGHASGVGAKQLCTVRSPVVHASWRALSLYLARKWLRSATQDAATECADPNVCGDVRCFEIRQQGGPRGAEVTWREKSARAQQIRC